MTPYPSFRAGLSGEGISLREIASGLRPRNDAECQEDKVWG